MSRYLALLAFGLVLPCSAADFDAGVAVEFSSQDGPVPIHMAITMDIDTAAELMRGYWPWSTSIIKLCPIPVALPMLSESPTGTAGVHIVQPGTQRLQVYHICGRYTWGDPKNTEYLYHKEK